MHKTITIVCDFHQEFGDNRFKELEFPILNKYLDEGWQIAKVYRSDQNASQYNADKFALTYLLYK